MHILIVDDHPAVREGVKSVLRRSGLADHVEEAASAREVLARLKERSLVEWDVVLLDQGLPDMEAHACATHIRAHLPHIPLVVLTDEPLPGVGRGARKWEGGAAFHLVAQAFVSKSAPTSELLEAIVRVSRGGTSFANSGARAAGPPNWREALSLTRREVEVLDLVRQGEANSDIARALGISVSTVKGLVRSLFNKTSVTNRTELLVRSHSPRWLGARPA